MAVTLQRRTTNQEIIDAYRETGSVWAAGKQLGMAGQTVWERLRALGYPLASRAWSKAEEAELALLASSCTIGEISRRLGRPYAGVAIKISRLGLGSRYGNHGSRKPPRGVGLDQSGTKQHIRKLEHFRGKITQYCRANGLQLEGLVTAIQHYAPEWWEAYVAEHSDLPQKRCPYCERTFFPMTAKQQFCSRSCTDQARVDQRYFSGKRRQAVGLAEKTCQLCERKVERGLAAHHLFGKENDPGDDHLIALCGGCHKLLTLVASRTFVEKPEAWENLIQLAMLRRGGKVPEGMNCLSTYVEMSWSYDEALEESAGESLEEA